MRKNAQGGKEGNSMGYYERAVELREETVVNRRYFHTNAETGVHTPKAQAYVLEKLRNMAFPLRRAGKASRLPWARAAER